MTSPVRFRWIDAVRDSSLPASTKHVGLTLATFMGTHNGHAYPEKVPTLVDATGLSKRTIDAAIDRLELAGFLRVDRSKGRAVNHYFATFPNNAAPAPLTVQQLHGSGVSNGATDSSEPCNEQQPTVQSTTRDRATAAPEPKSEAKSIRPEPSLDEPEPEYVPDGRTDQAQEDEQRQVPAVAAAFIETWRSSA